MIRFLTLLLILLSLQGNKQAWASCSSYDDAGCYGSGDRGDSINFAVSGTFFDPILNFTYNFENSIDLLVWTCHELCPTTFQLHWWGECQTQMDFNGNMQRVCARLVQAAEQTWICAFYDPLDNPNDPTNPGLDTNPSMSPFHGQVTTPYFVGTSTSPGFTPSFVDSSGSIYSHGGDCRNCSFNKYTGFYYKGNIDGNVSLSAAGYTSPPAPKSPIQTCQGVFGNVCADPSSLTQKQSVNAMINFMGQYGQVLSETQATTFLNSFKNLGSSLASTTIPLNARLPSGTGSGYNIQINPAVCALVPTAPAPPPFCSPMPASKPQAQIVPICSTTDMIGFASFKNNDPTINWSRPISSICPSQPVGQAIMPYYNFASKSSVLSPCEIGQSKGGILTNSYTTPAARVTFSQPFSAANCPPGTANMIPKTTAQQCLAGTSANTFTNQSTDVRGLYGIPGSDIDYATSPISSGFDPVSGQTLQDSLSLIAGNVANYIDLSYDATTTDNSPSMQITDPDGNTNTYLLQGVNADNSQSYGLTPGIYVFQQGNNSKFPIGQVKATAAPKPIIAPCNISKSDPDIMIGNSPLTMPQVSCTSTHTNPALAWSIDRSTALIQKYKQVDYESSYTDGNAELNALSTNPPTPYTSTLPTMSGTTLSVLVVDQNGNNPTLSTPSTGCATPSPIYGCYYSQSQSAVQCGSAPSQGDIYLSGLEYSPDTSQNVTCTGSTQVHPLKYVRGAKFACGIGGIDYGTVLTSYTGYDKSGVICSSTDLQSSDVSKDISKRLDPLYSPPKILNPITPSTNVMSLLGSGSGTTQYLNDLNYSTSIKNSPGTVVNSLKLPGNIFGVTQCSTACGNTRQKVPLESGFCVDVPQPSCPAYSTDYNSAAAKDDPNYQQQNNDGFANWSIADNQVYGTLFTGNCLPHTRQSNPNSPPIRFCTLDSSNNNGVISSVVNPCIPMPSPPAWWPSQATYVSGYNGQSPDSNITDAQWQQAWIDINYGFTNGTNVGVLGNNSQSLAFPNSAFAFSAQSNNNLYNNLAPANLNTFAEIPIIQVGSSTVAAYLPVPFLNNCVAVTNLTVQSYYGATQVQLCRANNTYYYKYNENYFFYKPGLGSASCIPNNITYSDNSGTTGLRIDGYVRNNVSGTVFPCCPAGTHSDSQGYCCVGRNVTSTGQCTADWLDGSDNNTCMKSTYGCDCNQNPAISSSDVCQE